MRVDREKLNFILAEQCKNLSDLCPALSASTLVRIGKGADVTTKSVGKLAKELGVTVDRLIAAKEE